MSTELISRKELCAITGVSYNELVAQFRSQARVAPRCIGKDSRNQLYDRDYALQWVHQWRSVAHKTRLQVSSPKLMILNVKRKKTTKICTKVRQSEKRVLSSRL